MGVAGAFSGCKRAFGVTGVDKVLALVLYDWGVANFEVDVFLMVRDVELLKGGRLDDVRRFVD